MLRVLRKRGLISLGGENFPDPSNQCYPFQPPYAFTIQLALEMLQTGNEIVCAENHTEYYLGKDTAIPTAAKPDF